MAIDLSVAIIFKNEIRCIERCLKSFLPLKEQVSCEIVMADTGSTDGSRAVAKRYADTLIDFPWVNDFSAARNAVLERCFGRWILVADCDEWLDADVSELSGFLCGKASKQKYDYVKLVIRNYDTAELHDFSDFMGSRLLRAASSPRYVGSVHEYPAYKRPLNKSCYLRNTILHHDGYVMLHDGSEAGRAKRLRNQTLLRQELKKTPDELRVLLQYLESAEFSDDDYRSTLEKAIGLVRNKQPYWNVYGQVIFRQAVYYASREKLPELHALADEAKSLFPDSYYTRIDNAFTMLGDAFDRQDNEAVIQNCETYLRAYERFPHDPRAVAEVSASSLLKNNPHWKNYVVLRLAGACCDSKQYERVPPLLEQLDWTEMDGTDVTYFVHVIEVLANRRYDVGPFLSACWNGIASPVPNEQIARERVEAFQSLVGVEDAEPDEDVSQGPQTRAGLWQDTNAELLALAEQVWAILARYPPDDPAVIELKNSAAYQKVAYLIER